MSRNDASAASRACAERRNNIIETPVKMMTRPEPTKGHGRCDLLDAVRAHVPRGIRPVLLRQHGLCHVVDGVVGPGGCRLAHRVAVD